MAAASERCRPTAPACSSSCRWPARLSASVARSRVRTRVAASSIASGSPSRRRQMPATCAAVAWSRRNCGAAARARSRNSRPAADCWTAAGSVPAGQASGGTGSTCSSLTPSGCRLVATTRRSGTARTSALSWPAATPVTWSQSSAISSILRPASATLAAVARSAAS